MVYKRYIKRGGKLCGPYYYESYRNKKGKVISRFVSGPTKKDKLLNKINPKVNKNFKKIMQGLFFGFVAFFMIILFFILVLGLNNFSKSEDFSFIKNQNIGQRLNTLSADLFIHLSSLVNGKSYSLDAGQINIIKAEHLDSNRVLLNEITDSVINKDDFWTNQINPDEFLRVYFEKDLTNKNDITLFAKSMSNNSAKIEIYPKDSKDLIASFDSIGKESFYKTYLTGIPEGKSYDVFDLKVKENPVQFDYVTDPESQPVKLWDTLGPTGQVNDLAVDNNGGVYVTGSNINFNLIKYNAINGQVIYNVSTDYGSNGNFTGDTVFYNNLTNGIYVLGDFINVTDSLASIIKFSPNNGSIIWSYYFKPVANYHFSNFFYSSMDNESNIYVASEISPTLSLFALGKYNNTLAKISSSGSLDWYNVNFIENTPFFGQIVIANNSIFLETIGTKCNPLTSDQFCLLNYNLEGVHLWNQTYSSYSTGPAIRLNTFNNSVYAALGAVLDPQEVIKFDSSGNKIWDNVTNSFYCNELNIDFDNFGNIYTYCEDNSYIRKHDLNYNLVWWNDTSDLDLFKVFKVESNNTYYIGGYDSLTGVYETKKFGPNTTDTTPPIINITYPENKSYNLNVSTITYSYSDENPGSCWYSTNGGGANSTAITAGTSFSNLTSIDGSNTLMVYCNDSYGNQNSSRVTFIKDLTSPNVTFNCTPLSVSVGETITCSCTGTDNFDSNLSVNYTVNPSTSVAGSLSTTCRITDAAGNSNSSNVSYTVTSSGGNTGGGGGGGGTFTSSKKNETNCTSNFVCDVWSICINDIQTRSCYDSCTNKTKKESQNCNLITEESSNSDCGDWSQCITVYNLNDIIKNNVFLKGEQTRTCIDKNKIYYEKRTCEASYFYLIKKVTKCFKEYLEISDLNNKLIIRLELADGVYRGLNLDINFENSDYCWYCYDKIKNYDEEGVDCSNKLDGNCPVCIRKKVIF